MIQVPVFGMENNPDSLYARRQAFMRSYGHTNQEVECDVELVTEVVGHVPYVPPTDILSFERHDETAEFFRVTLYSSVTPYTRAWVTIRYDMLVQECREYERGNLWTVALVEPVR